MVDLLAPDAIDEDPMLIISFRRIDELTGL